MIYDITGKLLFEKQPEDNDKSFLSIDLKSMVKGLYFIRIKTAIGSATKKLVKF
jgi:hypothetical protein